MSSLQQKYNPIYKYTQTVASHSRWGGLVSSPLSILRDPNPKEINTSRKWYTVPFRYYTAKNLLLAVPSNFEENLTILEIVQELSQVTWGLTPQDYEVRALYTIMLEVNNIIVNTQRMEGTAEDRKVFEAYWRAAKDYSVVTAFPPVVTKLQSK